MNKSLKLFLAVAATMAATLVVSEPLFARGGGGNIMNSPGYQRRLQESRHQLSQPDVRPSPAYRHTSRHPKRH